MAAASFPDCNANGIASIRGGFIVMEEQVNRACHLKPCAGLKCEIFLLTATIFVWLQMIKKRKSADCKDKPTERGQNKENVRKTQPEAV